MTSFSLRNTNKHFPNPQHVSYIIYQVSDGFWDSKVDIEISESKIDDRHNIIMSLLWLVFNLDLVPLILNQQNMLPIWFFSYLKNH